jgi:hypothetical protein
MHREPRLGQFPPTSRRRKARAERAQRKADRWQKLQKTGVLSKVEVEQAIGAANRASVRYQQARIAQLTADLEALRQRATRGEASADLVQSAESALQTAKQLAEDAEATARRTELEFAQNNLEDSANSRQQDWVPSDRWSRRRASWSR